MEKVYSAITYRIRLCKQVWIILDRQGIEILLHEIVNWNLYYLGDRKDKSRAKAKLTSEQESKTVQHAKVRKENSSLRRRNGRINGQADRGYDTVVENFICPLLFSQQ